VNQDMLKQAIKTNDHDLFVYLLSQDSSLAHSHFNKNFFTPLHLCCEYGRLDFARVLVTQCQADVNSVCQLTGYTPLMYACQVGNLEIVKFLVENKADHRVKSHLSGRDAKQIAVDARFDKVVDVITDLDRVK